MKRYDYEYHSKVKCIFPEGSTCWVRPVSAGMASCTSAISCLIQSKGIVIIATSFVSV